MIKEICKKCDSRKTISENLRDNDYLRIFDCGKSIFVKNYNSPSAISWTLAPWELATKFKIMNSSDLVGFTAMVQCNSLLSIVFVLLFL